MSRAYKCLSKNTFQNKAYSLVPIRDQDKYLIMQWRNEQLDILRQEKPLTKESQELYFETVIAKLFDQEKPLQLLWSILLNDSLIGYAGLVHIDWKAMNGEISFLLDPKRDENRDIFAKDFSVYLDMLSEIAFSQLNFHKIYTYAYDIRDDYFKVMFEKNFEQEARLKSHVCINGVLKDVRVLSKFNNKTT